MCRNCFYTLEERLVCSEEKSEDDDEHQIRVESLHRSMRLRIGLTSEAHSLKLPIQHNHLLQGLIYANLDQALSEWLHNKGHAYGLRRFKLFTFSRLFG